MESGSDGLPRASSEEAAGDHWSRAQLQVHQGGNELALPANNAFVMKTPMLGWANDGRSMATVPSHVLLRTFVGRCHLRPELIRGVSSGTSTLCRHSALSTYLRATAWVRLFQAYMDSGLLEVEVEDWQALRERVLSLHMVNPYLLALSEEDFTFGETFKEPATAGTPAQGQPGRRGYRPATTGSEEIEGPPALEFIAACNITRLHAPEDPEPLAQWALLAGALGAAATRAARLDPFSQPRLAAETLENVVSQFLGVANPSIAKLAVSIKDALNYTSLPVELKGNSPSAEAALAEIADGAKFKLGNPALREAVEAARVQFLSANRCEAAT